MYPSPLSLGRRIVKLSPEIWVVHGAKPTHIRNLTVCSTLCLKKKLDLHLSTIPDLPNTPNLSNSLDNKYKL